jgi:glutamyl-tRNA(Gln) amidotransferase subunit D
MLKQGEKVEIKTGSESYSGRFVKEDDSFVFIKLKSGYNIGISKRKIKEVKSEGGLPEKKDDVKHTIKENKSLPTIALLHTGGTIASKVDYETGAVSAKFSPEEILSLFPELGEIANVRSTLISNIMSENMRFHHYNLMAKAILEEVKKGADGIIVTHGTDTMHYTAAALSFMLENLSIPVVLIGSQRSSDRPSSDSSVNLICASIFIANSKASGVFICMHENMSDGSCIVVEGANARKMHSSRRDAFRPINKEIIARISFEDRKIEMVGTSLNPPGKQALSMFDEKVKVGILKMHPHMFASELDTFDHFDGLIIEGTGLGHAEIIKVDENSEENERIKEKLSKLAKKIPVAMTTQTIYGRVNMNVYSPGRELIEMGIIGNYCDMTPETAFIKLAWLLSSHKKNQMQEIKELFEKNLRGEISERSETGTFLK